jgi:hypothetical protein
MALLPPFADALYASPDTAGTQTGPAPTQFQTPVQTPAQPPVMKRRDMRRKHPTRGKNYTIYITPEEHALLTALGKRMQPDGGVSVGIRFLINFFRAEIQKRQS